MKKVKINLVIEGEIVEIDGDSELTAERIAEIAPDIFVNCPGVDMDYDYLSIGDVTATCEFE